MNLLCVTTADVCEPDDEWDLGNVIAATLVQVPGGMIGREIPDGKWDENTEYIAAVNPQTMLELLDMIDQLQRMNNTLSQEVDELIERAFDDE
jgi:hypothetical protein